MKKRPATLLTEAPDGAFGHADLLRTLENQIKDNNPPETQRTLKRLMALGETRDYAIHLLACVLSAEIFELVHAQGSFDLERYVSHLQALPELPYDPEDLPT